MKITLVSPYVNVTSLSIRYLSSWLRSNGHETTLVFLPDLFTMADTGVDFRGYYSEQVARELAELASGSDLIGFTLMTNYFYKTAALTDRLRDLLDVPVIWGGPHPTVAPEECLEHADLVCTGEGEAAFLEVLARLESGSELTGIPNVISRGEGLSEPASLAPPIENLDTLPFPDFSLEDHHVLLGENIVPLTEDLLREFCSAATNFDDPDEIIYETISSRGCPHHCAFCINSRYVEMYRGYRFFRRRSVENLIEELEQVTSRFPWFNRIVLQDDSFTATTPRELEKFATLYTEKIGFPFFFLLSSKTMDEARMKPLIDAGLSKIQVGIQSASTRTNALFERSHFSPEELLERAIKLQELTGGTKTVAYDIILDNPLEDTAASLETLELAMKLPRPKQLQLYSLTYYPGTDIHRMLIERGLITDPRVHYMKENHEKDFRYLNLLFTLANRGISSGAMKLLSWKPLVLLMESPPVRKLLSLFAPAYNRAKLEAGRRFLLERYSGILKMAGYPALNPGEGN